MSLEIKLKDKVFVPFLKEDEIMRAIDNLSQQINKDYVAKKVLFVVVLNGAFVFASDLLKRVKLQNAEVEFIKLSSYNGIYSTGGVNKIIGLERDVKDYNIIVVEDIVETGNTFFYLKDLLVSKNPISIEIATLLFKPECYHHHVDVKYVGLKITNDFVVGYGLDYDNLGRNLPEIYRLKNS